MDRLAMRGEAWPRGDVGRHGASKVQRRLRGLRKQRDDEIFERDYANLQLQQFGIGQRGARTLRAAWRQVRAQTSWDGAAFVFPPLERHLPLT